MKQAACFYVLDGFVSDHVAIAQQMSALCRHLAAFEPDLSTRSKLHKRRITRLDALSRDLNPAAFPSLFQQLVHIHKHNQTCRYGYGLTDAQTNLWIVTQ